MERETLEREKEREGEREREREGEREGEREKERERGGGEGKHVCTCFGTTIYMISLTKTCSHAGTCIC